MTLSIDPHRDVLDHETVDANGEACGMVDGLQFTHSPPHGRRIAALRVGPGAWLPRLPALLQVIGERLLGRRWVTVPWHHVVEVSEVIRLDVSAGAVGLGRLDRVAARWLQRLPRS